MQVPVGAALEVEIFTPEGVDSIRLRGDVARVSPMGHGEYAIGVVLRVMPASMGTLPPSPYTDRDAARGAVRVTMQDTRELLWQGRLPVADTRALAQAAAKGPDAPRVDRATLWRRRLAAVAVLLLLALAIWLASMLWPYVKDSPLLVRGERPASEEAVTPPNARRRAAVSESPTREEAREISDFLSAVPIPPMSAPFEAAWNRVEAGIAREAAPTSLGTAPALLGVGLAPPSDPLPDEADDAASAPEDDPGFGAGGPETDPSELGENNLAPDDVRASALALMMPSEEPAPPESIRIEVDRSAYTLTILRGDRSLRTIPIGIGANDATPTGTFVIANKLTDPYWYNRGQSVPPGDPNNPIGHRWMGLGDAKGPTSYGLHPTAETDAIGEARSRGCVRLRPEDAESLFRLCPIGTQVIIK